MLLGTITAIPAYLSGSFLTEELTGKAGHLQDAHGQWALFTVISALLSSLISTYFRMFNTNTSLSKGVIFISYAVTCSLLLITGTTGGNIAH